MTALRLPLLAAALLASTATAAAQSISIENFIGTVDIVPGAALSIDGEAPDSARLDGMTLRVDGNESMKTLSCSDKRGDITVRRGKLIGGTSRKLSDYPALRITAPAGTRFEIKDSLVIGTSSDLGEVDLGLPKCGRFEFSDVSGPFKAALSGSADVTAGNVGEARLATSGSGDFQIADADSLTFSSSGSGDVQAGDVAGPATVRSSGSGDAVIQSVSGDLEFRSTGSGDLMLGRLDGNAKMTSTGSGDMQIDSADIPTLTARSTGSGDLSVGGRVGDADLVSTGSGDFVFASQDGKLKHRSMGSGSVTVDGRTIKKR